MHKSVLFVAIVLSGLCASPATRGETVNCINITSLPATISSQGVYCLKQDIATAISSGNAITIATNNVTLDCNGFKLGGLGAGLSTLAKGVSATGRANVVVRNCNVRGFRMGIALSGSGHLVESNRLDGNTTHGILVEGENGMVRDNRVFDTGGVNVASRGIETSGSVDVVGNTVSGVETAAGSVTASIGVYSQYNMGASIHSNVIRDVHGQSGSFAIALAASPLASVRGNTLFNAPGANPGTGILCVTGAAVVAGNHVFDFTNPITGCSATGTNLIP